MNNQKQLALAIKIASNAHHGQFDRGGNPYVLHPLHLMNQLLWSTDLATIAVLHDVVEDTDVTFEYLKDKGFSKRVLDALKLLTHADGESYDEYITKMLNNLDAVLVKRKDLEHNSDITRLKNKVLTEKDLARTAKYHKAFLRLTEAKHRLQNPENFV